MTAQPKERNRPYKIAEDTDATVAKETEATDTKETDVTKAGTDIHTTPPVASNGLQTPPPSARR